MKKSDSGDFHQSENGVFLRENKKSDVKVGADECFLIVTFIFQTILNLVLRQIP